MPINPLVEQLYLAQALKESPLEILPPYLSFRSDLLSSLARAFKPVISSLHYDFIYPSELFSVPLATHLSLLYDIPLFLSCHQDAFIRSGQTALIVDTSSSFSSNLSSYWDDFKKKDIVVSDALLLLEGSPEDKKNSQKCGITLHSLWDMKALQEDLNTLLHQNSYSKIHPSDIS